MLAALAAGRHVQGDVSQNAVVWRRLPQPLRYKDEGEAVKQRYNVGMRTHLQGGGHGGSGETPHEIHIAGVVTYQTRWREGNLNDSLENSKWKQGKEQQVSSAVRTHCTQAGLRPREGLFCFKRPKAHSPTYAVPGSFWLLLWSQHRLQLLHQHTGTLYFWLYSTTKSECVCKK